MIKWYGCCSLKEPTLTLKVDFIVTYYRQRHDEVIIKWYRYCSLKEPTLTLKVETIITYYRQH